MDMFSIVWESMVTERRRVNAEFSAVRSEIEAATTIIQNAFADLPLAADGMTEPETRWVTNGRKTGEGAGAGTGVYAYYNPPDNTWKRFSDDATVTI